MADLTVNELFSAQTKEQILESMIQMSEDIGLPARSWNPKGVTRTLYSVTASLLVMFCVPILSLIRSGFLETASGAWLTLHAFFFYGVSRRVATFAVGNVTIDNASGASYNIVPGGLIVLNTVNNKTYRNTATAIVGPMQQNVVVPVQAIEIGTDSDAAPGQITGFETPLTGLTVTNDNPVLGSNEESDDDLKATCKAKIQSLSPNGPRGAYEYFARRTYRPDGSIVPINRVQVTSSSPNATVTVWVTTESGVVTAPDLALVEATIFLNCVPTGITPTVDAATPVVVPVSYQLWAVASEGLTEAELEDLVADALVDLFREYPIGGRVKGLSTGRLYSELVRSTVAKADPSVFDAALVGFSDVELLDGEVATLGTITPDINFES